MTKRRKAILPFLCGFVAAGDDLAVRGPWAGGAEEPDLGPAAPSSSPSPTCLRRRIIPAAAAITAAMISRTIGLSRMLPEEPSSAEPPEPDDAGGAA